MTTVPLKSPNQKYSEATPILPPGPLIFNMILEIEGCLSQQGTWGPWNQ